MSMIGKTLGHYEISAPLGRGGMGEVYQAKDRKLGRDVAIKVLPEEFARDTDRVARFQREAKLLASLNHPNIAGIHGLEEAGGTSFLVLELVEGQTLADRIKAGPIPVEESLKLALQIAEALEAAHEKGVIHRDLKPANIKVTPDGKVKVLDFGLAKAFAGEQADLNLSNSPTLSDAATQQGLILGTAAYMSPEQARGKSVDKRADIWAFGCVLFEMLTGRTLFAGDDVSQTLARVLERQPDFSSLPPNLHPKIIEMLERCLEKEARNRYGSISDARVDIQKVLADPRGVLVQPVAAVEPRTRLRTLLPWAAAVVGLIVVGVAVWNLKPTPPLEQRQVTRFDHDLGEDQQFSDFGLVYPTLAVSPNGRQFVYCTSKGLYLRSADELDARLIPGTEWSQLPFFSPDGKWIGYFSSDSKLKTIAISGGEPVALCDAGRILGASWTADNTIIYCEGGKGIMRISAGGGSPETLIQAENENFYHPRLLPDGKSVIFTLGPPPYKIAVQSLESRERKVLFTGDCAWYLPTGHIVYALKNNLFAIPFHPDTFQIAGRPVSMVEGVFRLAPSWAPQYAISISGTLVYMPKTIAAASPASTLMWVDRSGKEEPLAAPPDTYSFPRISPDGTKVALCVGRVLNSDVWIWDIVRKTLTRLTFDAATAMAPLWTPDGKWIAYASSREGNVKIYRKASDGTGKIEALGSRLETALAQTSWFLPAFWSSDAKTLVQIEVTVAANIQFDIGALSMEGDRARKPLLHEEYRV